MFTILILLALIVCFIVYIGSWVVDREMNVESGNPFDYVKYNRFLVEFEKYDRQCNLKDFIDGNSIIKNGSELRRIVYIHAGLIEFEGKNMIITFCDYWKFKLWLKRYTRKKYSGIWDN